MQSVGITGEYRLRRGDHLAVEVDPATFYGCCYSTLPKHTSLGVIMQSVTSECSE